MLSNGCSSMLRLIHPSSGSAQKGKKKNCLQNNTVAVTAIHTRNTSIDKSHQQRLQHRPKSCSEALPDQHRHCSPSFAFQCTLPKTLTAAAHPALRRMSRHQALALNARANLRLKCSIAALVVLAALQWVRVSERRDKIFVGNSGGTMNSIHHSCWND